MARYLIEDNTEDTVEFNENKKNSVTIIKSVLKNMIGKYTLFTLDEKAILKKEI